MIVREHLAFADHLWSRFLGGLSSEVRGVVEKFGPPGRPIIIDGATYYFIGHRCDRDGDIVAVLVSLVSPLDDPITADSTAVAICIHCITGARHHHA